VSIPQVDKFKLMDSFRRVQLCIVDQILKRGEHVPLTYTVMPVGMRHAPPIAATLRRSAAERNSEAPAAHTRAKMRMVGTAEASDPAAGQQAQNTEACAADGSCSEVRKACEYS
jgi:hypothetical protein